MYGFSSYGSNVQSGLNAAVYRMPVDDAFAVGPAPAAGLCGVVEAGGSTATGSLVWKAARLPAMSRASIRM